MKQIVLVICVLLAGRFTAHASIGNEVSGSIGLNKAYLYYNDYKTSYMYTQLIRIVGFR